MSNEKNTEKTTDRKKKQSIDTALGRWRTVRWICTCAMLIALEIVLNRFLSINTMGWKIGFAFIPPMLAAMLYGPGTCALVWALADLLGALLFPIGPYHPGFTICNAIMGFNLGVMLHSDPLHMQIGGRNLTFSVNLHWEKIKLYNILIPVLVNCLAVGLVINTYWVSTLYGSKTYWGWFLYRLPEYLIMIPVQVILAPVLLQLTRILRKLGLAGRAPAGRG